MHAFRIRGVIGRSQPNHFPILLSSSFPSTSSVGRKTAFVRYQQAKTESVQPAGNTSNNMDKTQNPNQKNGDVMSDSFGEGYSTRSDEEGFGGIYGGNQSLPNKHAPPDDAAATAEQDNKEYDKSQGSEANEKEKGRNQPNAC